MMIDDVDNNLVEDDHDHYVDNDDVDVCDVDDVDVDVEAVANDDDNPTCRR